MLCRLCFENSGNCFNFFETEGLELQAAAIIGKYFWFEPRNDDTESKYVCRLCWSVTYSFHNLYILVGNSQKKLENKVLEYSENKLQKFFTECESVKSENNSLYGDNYDFLHNSEYLDSQSNNLNEQISDPKHIKQYSETENKDGNNIELTKPVKYRITRSRKKLETTEKCMSTENNQINVKKVAVRIKKKKREKSNWTKKSVNLEPSELLKKKKNQCLIVSDAEIYKMKRIICQICLIEIPTFLELKKHFAQAHDEEGYAICCDKKFYKRYKFVHHLKMHVNPHEYKCPHCDKQLGSTKYVKLHIKNMHTKIEKIRNFSCDICTKSFVQKGALSRHMLTHVPESEKLFQCEKCEKSFPTKGILRTHKITVHEGRYGGICALCGKKYQNPQDLKRHCLEHEGITEPKAQCEICGAWLANKYKLKRHMIKHNTSHLEHRCPHCNKLSPNEIALKSHIKFTHNDSNKIHQCSICEKAFRRRIDLKEHTTVHTGEHLYTCPHCPRTFTHHSNLHHHRKKMHRKEFDEERMKRGINKTPWIKRTEIKKDSELFTAAAIDINLNTQINIPILKE